MKQKILFGIIALLVIIGVIFISRYVGKECKTDADCLTKTCFMAQCDANNECVYASISDCCGNDICEVDEGYPKCAADCPDCNDDNKCTEDSYDYHEQKCLNKIIVPCCGNGVCDKDVETYSSCSADCPDCNDDNECTKDSYDYYEQKCIYKLIAPCYLKPITLAPATSEIDYQIKLELTPSNFNYSKAKTNGEDIRFFDENDNPLNYWIEDWDGAGRVSVIWVKVTSPGTDKIYMHYGHPDASPASSGSAVFEFFDNFDYSDESELIKVWNKHDSPVIELSDSIVTITASGAGEHGGQHIFKNIGSSTLLNNIVEIYTKRFSGYHSHMANIGYTSSNGGPISDGDCWAALRYSPSPEGTYLVFGGNHGGITSSPIDSFNIIKIYHQEGVSYAYEPPSTKVAEYNWPKGPPTGGYVLLGGATTISGRGKASYDWIRVRKYISTEPSATVGNEKVVGEGTSPGQ